MEIKLNMHIRKKTETLNQGGCIHNFSPLDESDNLMCGLCSLTTKGFSVSPTIVIWENKIIRKELTIQTHFILENDTLNDSINKWIKHLELKIPNYVVKAIELPPREDNEYRISAMLMKTCMQNNISLIHGQRIKIIIMKK
eukprot:TRINITY_DN4788_c0_g1_i2.p1 TRINITY_DN4788_c0_g1~~TRINITY_DN4788_c0_g1_i2.p1  ORF type:complete len:141 (+),score=18.21 TRINITY_DN4788_c0_g1_i2:228-650(+)